MIERTAVETRLILAAGCLAAGAQPVLAQKGDPAASFPARPIRIIVPFTPAASPTSSPAWSAKNGESLGQQVVVDNRVGAAA